MEGEVEMIRFADLKFLSPAQSEDVERKKYRNTTAKIAVLVGLQFFLMVLNKEIFTGILPFQRNEGEKQ